MRRIRGSLLKSGSAKRNTKIKNRKYAESGPSRGPRVYLCT
jgi:hypothetical protein